MTPGNSLLLVYIGWEYLLKLKKELKLFLSVRPSTALAGFLKSKYSVSCLQTEMGCCHWRLPLAPAEQSIQLLYVIPADKDFAIVNHKTIPTKKVYLYTYIQAINLNPRRRCAQTEIVRHFSLLMFLAPAEQTIQLLIGAEQQLLLYHTIKLKKTINLDLGKRWELC